MIKFHKRVGMNEINSRKAVPNKRVGWTFMNWVGWNKCEKGGKKCENANRVDSFIWHLRVNREQILAFDLKIAEAGVVAEAVKVLIDVDQAHILGPSGVGSGIAICIQDGESEQFDE